MGHFFAGVGVIIGAIVVGALFLKGDAMIRNWISNRVDKRRAKQHLDRQIRK